MSYPKEEISQSQNKSNEELVGEIMAELDQLTLELAHAYIKYGHLLELKVYPNVSRSIESATKESDELMEKINELKVQEKKLLSELAEIKSKDKEEYRKAA